jgi:hypothetical protein
MRSCFVTKPTKDFILQGINGAKVADLDSIIPFEVQTQYTHLTMSPRSDAKIPANASLTHDGWSSEDEATATCFCGAVQLIVVGSPDALCRTR